MKGICLCLNMQAKLARDLKYNQESFWLRIVDLRENFNDDKFTNLFEVKTKVDKSITWHWRTPWNRLSFKNGSSMY